jgi:hypothetical protein
MVQFDKPDGPVFSGQTMESSNQVPDEFDTNLELRKIAYKF